VSATPQPWPAREVAVVLPLGTAKAMFARARQWDVDAVGRFDARGAAIVVWSGQLGELGESSEPIGTVYVRWHDPTDDQATLWKGRVGPGRGQRRGGGAAGDRGPRRRAGAAVAYAVSPRGPRVTAAQVLRAPRRDGWAVERRSGSHAQLRHPTKPGQVTVPRHAGVILSPKTLARSPRRAG
jgi:predicted RNA binding protein YcfA (HicA-like mRNA interferase family)